MERINQAGHFVCTVKSIVAHRHTRTHIRHRGIDQELTIHKGSSVRTIEIIVLDAVNRCAVYKLEVDNTALYSRIFCAGGCGCIIEDVSFQFQCSGRTLGDIRGNRRIIVCRIIIHRNDMADRSTCICIIEAGVCHFDHRSNAGCKPGGGKEPDLVLNISNIICIQFSEIGADKADIHSVDFSFVILTGNIQILQFQCTVMVGRAQIQGIIICRLIPRLIKHRILNGDFGCTGIAMVIGKRAAVGKGQTIQHQIVGTGLDIDIDGTRNHSLLGKVAAFICPSNILGVALLIRVNACIGTEKANRTFNINSFSVRTCGQQNDRILDTVFLRLRICIIIVRKMICIVEFDVPRHCHCRHFFSLEIKGNGVTIHLSFPTRVHHIGFGKNSTVIILLRCCRNHKDGEHRYQHYRHGNERYRTLHLLFHTTFTPLK